jgi:hypothetical protein
LIFQELRGELLHFFQGDAGQVGRDSVSPFPELALEVFRYQWESNPAYRGFASRRGREPQRVTHWEEIPFLPTRAFKSTALVSGDPRRVERVFRTSGTSLGRGMRGEHHVLDLDLYRGSLLPNFLAHLIPDEKESFRILSLLPAPEVARDSSLSFMMGEVVKALGDEGSSFFVGKDGEIEMRAFRRATEDAERDEVPVLVAGTAFAFVHWLEQAREKGWGVELPEGSRILETGGYKGRSRELARVDLYRGLTEAFGVHEASIANEYGMTELLSQFYEPVLGTSAPSLEDRFHRGPPWVRTLVLDPLTLDALPEGQVGVLAHLDLANLGSVAAILTEDLGRMVPGGFQLKGRSPGSEPRGCSLAMEDFLASGKVR